MGNSPGFARKIVGVNNDYFVEPNADGSLNTIDRNYVWNGTAWEPMPTPETRLATSAKQDTLLTELQLKADLTDTQPVHDGGNNLILREILEQLNIPLWYDPATNSLKAVVTGAVTATMSSTVASGVTAIGGIPADPVVKEALNQTWFLGVRGLLV